MKSKSNYQCAWCKQCFTRSVLIKRHLIVCRIHSNSNLNTNSNFQKYLGKYKNEDLYVKYGKYGYFVVYGNNKKSLKGMDIINLKNIKYDEVIEFLENNNINENKNSFIINLNENLSIRNGAYGYYIFYKPPKSKKAQFFNLKNFKGEINQENKINILKWIKDVYKIE